MIYSNMTPLLVIHLFYRGQVGTIRMSFLDIKRSSSCFSRVGTGIVVHVGGIPNMALNERKNLCCKNIIDVRLDIDVSVDHDKTSLDTTHKPIPS